MSDAAAPDCCTPVYEEIFSTDQHPSWPITTAWHWNEQVGSVINRVTPLPEHVIETKVQFIVSQVFLSSSCCIT